MTIKETVGSRGKHAEKVVEALLKQWNNKAGFAYFRLADARAAMGRLSAQPGDIAYFCGNHAGVIEIKSSEHPYRIAKDKIKQLPTLVKLELAGARSVILILHKVSGKWRVAIPSQLEMGPPSWNLSEFPMFENPEDALRSTGYFGEEQ